MRRMNAGEEKRDGDGNGDSYSTNDLVAAESETSPTNNSSAGLPPLCARHCTGNAAQMRTGSGRKLTGMGDNGQLGDRATGCPSLSLQGNTATCEASTLSHDRSTQHQTVRGAFGTGSYSDSDAGSFSAGSLL